MRWHVKFRAHYLAQLFFEPGGLVLCVGHTKKVPWSEEAKVWYQVDPAMR